MTKLRTSDVSDEAVMYRDEPVELFGARVRNVASPGERGIGWFKTMGQGVSIDGFGYARDQWWTLKDYIDDPSSQPLTEKRYEELRDDPMRGPAEIPYDPAISERQFRNRIRKFRRDEYMGTFSRSTAGSVGRFVGAMGGSMLAPEVIATLPIGGPMFAAAGRAKTTLEMVEKSIVGGLQVSAVATPLNIASQEAVYGQVDATEVLMTAVAPVLFAPPMVAFGRLFSKGEQTAASVANETPPPHLVPEPKDEYIPQDFISRFERFDGGVENWLTKIGERDPQAVEFARELGIDERGLQDIFDMTWREAAVTPLDTRAVQDFDAITAYAAGQERPDQLRWLWARGLAGEADAARSAQVTTPTHRTIDDLLAQRNVTQRRAEVERLYPELAPALRYREYALSQADTVPTQAVREQAALLDRAVRDGNPGIAPAEFREVAERLITAESKDRATQRIAYRGEIKDRKLLARAAANEEGALREFAGRFSNDLPQDAKKDFEAFRNGGLEAVRARYAQRLGEDLETQLARLGELQEARAGKKGRAPKELTQQKKAVQSAVDRLETELARVRSQPVREPASINVDQLAAVLNAAGVRNKAAPQQAQAPRSTQPDSRSMDADAAPTMREPTENEMDAIIAEYEQFAREAGVPLEDLDNGYNRAANALRNCR